MKCQSPIASVGKNNLCKVTVSSPMNPGSPLGINMVKILGASMCDTMHHINVADEFEKDLEPSFSGAVQSYL